MPAIAPESINPLALPSLPLVDRRQLPELPGIYLQSQEGPLYNNERQEINKRQRRSVYLWSEVFRGAATSRNKVDDPQQHRQLLRRQQTIQIRVVHFITETISGDELRTRSMALKI